MDDAHKDRMNKALRGYIEQVEAMRAALEHEPQAERARKALMMAKFEMLTAIHEVKWIGHRNEDEEVQEEILPHTDEINSESSRKE